MGGKEMNMSIPEGYRLVPVELLKRLSDLWPDCGENDGSARVGWLQHVTKIVRDLKSLIDSKSQSQPTFDESAERKLFEAKFPTPEGLMWDESRNQYFGTSYYWIQQNRWKAWLACAQSRAKSMEIDHE